METKITQIISALTDKKKWENPTLVVIDSARVNSGTVFTGIEGAFTPTNGVKSYHS